jgi:hypothetical protein
MNNVGEAFSFPFKDPNWLTKFMIGAFFVLLSLFMIGLPVLYGYYIELLRRVRRGEEYPLPEWTETAVKFITGVKYLVTLFIYALPILVIFVPVIILTAVAAISGVDPQEVFGSALLVLVILFVILPYSLIVALLTPLIAVKFAERESIGDGLRVRMVFALFKRHWEGVVTAFLVTIGVGLAASLGLIIFLIGIFFTSFYASLVTFHLYGQIGRTIQTTL